MISSRNLEGKHLNIPENDRFADSFRDVFELNSDGSQCAVSLNGGFLGVMDTQTPENDLIIYDESEYSRFDGQFIGQKLAFSAAGSPGSVFGIIDCEEGLYLGDMEGSSVFGLRQYGGRLYVSQNDTLVGFDTDTFEQSEIAYTENKNINTFDISDKFAITASDDSYSIFFKEAGKLQTEQSEKSESFSMA